MAARGDRLRRRGPRGGLSISICLVPHETPGPIAGAFSANGKTRAESAGLAGGYPGGAGRDLIVRDTDVRRLLESGVIPAGLDELGGSVETVHNRTETLIGLRDAIFVHPGGGGRYGDPLTRDADAVADDVRARRVSAAVAHDVYGVVLDSRLAAVDGATAFLRTELRRQRINAEPTDGDPGAGSRGTPIDANLAAAVDGSVACRHCGGGVGVLRDGVPDGAVVREHLVPDAVPGMAAGGYVDRELVFRTWSCPGCATQIRAEVAVAG